MQYYQNLYNTVINITDTSTSKGYILDSYVGIC